MVYGKGLNILFQACCGILPDQHHVPLFEDRMAEVVDCLSHVHEIIAGLKCAPDQAIPALSDL